MDREDVVELVRRAEYVVDADAVAAALVVRILRAATSGSSEQVLVTREDAAGALEPHA